MQKVLFIDRDGTLVKEPTDEQVDSFEKLEFMPGVFNAMRTIANLTDYKFVMVTNQDGLGTDSFPEDTFWPVHNFILKTLQGEGIVFDEVLIDRTFPEDNCPTRKPGTAMLTDYINGDCDMEHSYVIGDRDTDVMLAKNLGCKALKLSEDMPWSKITEIVVAGARRAQKRRTTHETDVFVSLNLDGVGNCDISTGIGFFDHMLEQIAKHGNIDLDIKVKGDLNVDEHHTIEDTAIVLGLCLREALGDKRGIQRYGFCLPMDDCLCQVSLDFSGRPWTVWNADFHREKIGDMPTEMFLHFFKSLADNAMINLNVKAEGENEHHKIEGVFKAFARALKLAVHRDLQHFYLPSSKGTL